jgi:hypothetical protein
VLARAASVVSILVLVGGVLLVMSCQALSPANKPIDACVHSCTTHASRSCSDAECGRGCEFILDRLLEKEMNNVIACVVRTPRRCTDVVWADCAVHIGVHADGGPPAPPPPAEEE